MRNASHFLILKILKLKICKKKIFFKKIVDRFIKKDYYIFIILIEHEPVKDYFLFE